MREGLRTSAFSQIAMSYRLLIACVLACCTASFASSGNSADPAVGIIAHRIRSAIVPSSGEFNCVDTITVRRTGQGGDTVRFRLQPFIRPVNVTIGGKRVEPERIDDLLLIRGAPDDPVIDVVLTYSVDLSVGTEFSRIGPEYATLRSEDIFPAGSGIVRSVRLVLSVPPGWTTVAAGRLIASDTTEAANTFTWQSDDTINTFGWICAGTYVCESAVKDGVPVSLCRFPADSVQSEDIISLAADVLKFYSSRLTPYRFPKLSIVEIDDRVAGSGVLAIASPSCILVKRMAFTTPDRFNQIRSILPHEIAHQWWALTVFPADDALSFLSEGMCEALSEDYAAARNTATLRDSLGRHPLLRPLLMRTRQSGGLKLHERIDIRSRPSLYLKAAYVHHMLAGIVGDSCSRLIRKEAALRYSLRRITLDDYRSIAESVSGKTLGWFFDEWLDGTSLPQLKCYNVRTARAAGGWLTEGRLRILGYGRFTCPVTVAAFLPVNRRITTRVWLGIDTAGIYRNDVPFEFHSSSRPDSIVVDPDADLLKMQRLPSKLSDFRDPSDVVMITGTRTNAAGLSRLARRDSAEMVLAGWEVRIVPDSAATLGDLQSQRVICYGGTGENKVSDQLAARFPLMPNGDTLLVNGELVSDSSLSLIQVVDNPYYENGLLCWIVPFGAGSEPIFLPYNASWVLTRGKEVITSGVWPVVDRELSVEVP